MITFNFYTPKEKLPNHGDEIIFLRKDVSFDTEFFDVRVGIVEYECAELDENGVDTGTSICYEGNEHLVNDPDVELRILIDAGGSAYYFEDEVFCWNYPFDNI